MTKRSLNKIVEKANDNTSMKEFIILKTTKHMRKLMIMKTMIAGRITVTEADFECGVDCNEMGKFNKDDSDDIHSIEEVCLESLCTPLLIKNAMTDTWTTWEDLE